MTVTVDDAVHASFTNHFCTANFNTYSASGNFAAHLFLFFIANVSVTVLTMTSS